MSKQYFAKLAKQLNGLNCETQYYKTIPLRLSARNLYTNRKAMRFLINNTEQAVWIPKKHLKDDGTIKHNENIDYVFLRGDGVHKLYLAGITQAIPGIKLQTMKP